MLRTIRLRNRVRWVNDYYDDMAWLALASGRLALLHTALGRVRPQRRLRTAERDLTRQLRSALTDELGGGLYWNVERDFKNVPASAPAALHLARLGQTDEARAIVDWLYARLWSAESGLFLDGVRLAPTSTQTSGLPRPSAARTEVVVPDLWSYNQGTVLGALVTLGDEQSLRRAADLVAAVSDRLTTESDGIRLLRTHGDGDGGLFTGILGRYVALAATTDGLAPSARAAASALCLEGGRLVARSRPPRSRPCRRRLGVVARPGRRSPGGPAAGGADRAVDAGAGLDPARSRRIGDGDQPRRLTTKSQLHEMTPGEATVALYVYACV